MTELTSSNQLTNVEKIMLFLLESVIALFNLIPINLRIGFFSQIFRLVLFIKPKYKNICFKNLSQVFPDKDTAFKEKIYQDSIKLSARLMVDLLRIPSLTEESLGELFLPASHENLENVKKQMGTNNIVFLTGHLGSFELASLVLSINDFSPHIVARQLKQRWIESWMLKTRRKFDVNVIAREGAYRRILRVLRSGGNVGLAFDQNVTRNHAVFVDFFGRPAATTFAPGNAALENRSKICMLGVRYVGNEKYFMDTDICDCEDIYADTTVTTQEKIQQITLRITKSFEKLLLKQPEGWFWMHRRWKTTPEGVVEDFYGTQASLPVDIGKNAKT